MWQGFLAGYAAGVGALFSSCWRALAAAYPDTPVLLSRRADADTGYRSMEAAGAAGAAGRVGAG